MFHMRRWRPIVRRSSVVKMGIALALVLSVTSGALQAVHASGNPPSNSKAAPAGGVDALHGGNAPLQPGVVRKSKGTKLPNGIVAPASLVYSYDPVVMVHGLQTSSSGGGHDCLSGNFANPRAYLYNSAGHRGLGSDMIYFGGTVYTVGFYNNDTNCNYQLSTLYNPAPACDGFGGISNNDYHVGTTDEPLAHVSCEFAWYIYNNFSRPYLYQNVKVVAASMGGLIVRYAIQKVQQHDSHFPTALYISDVVTFSAPMGGISWAQAAGNGFGCGFCGQDDDMITASAFMADISSHDHPEATNGTDWTMLGSLTPINDPLDWATQATYMSNTPGKSNNHRIGYSAVPASCPGQPGFPTGYGHGDYVNDQCDNFDASYYYCDGCSRTKTSGFSFANAAAPHSLHEMLFAFVYANW